MRLVRENPRRGAVRIQGELRPLGHDVSAEKVRRYRLRALRPPSPSRSLTPAPVIHRGQSGDGGALRPLAAPGRHANAVDPRADEKLLVRRCPPPAPALPTPRAALEGQRRSERPGVCIVSNSESTSGFALSTAFTIASLQHSPMGSRASASKRCSCIWKVPRR